MHFAQDELGNPVPIEETVKCCSHCGQEFDGETVEAWVRTGSMMFRHKFTVVRQGDKFIARPLGREDVSDSIEDTKVKAVNAAMVSVGHRGPAASFA